MSKLLRFLKNWTLPVAIVAGAVSYLVYARLPLFNPLRPYAASIVAVVQPLFLFAMLFLSFCKIDIRQLRPRLSHLWLILFQCGTFVLLCLLVGFARLTPGMAVMIESALLCLVCPTATASSVVTQKLGGDTADVTMYLILINLAVSLVIPLMLPLVSEVEHISFLSAGWSILTKVFPLLIGPLATAQLLRYVFPRVHRRVLAYSNSAFYLWAVSLALAIAVTTRSIVHTTHPFIELAGIAAASLVCCIVQFAFGRWLGGRCGRRVSTSQALGQKNTVFIIWLGYTFLNPVTSLAGGFYSIWHNVYNTWQLRQCAKRANRQ